MTNTLTLLILLILTGLCISGCSKMTPEQELKIKELKVEMSAANTALAEALQIPSNLIVKLNAGEIDSVEFEKLMASGKETIANAQKKVSDTMLKYQEAKEAGISTAQIAWSFAGGTLGRSALHIAAGLLSGTPFGGLIAPLLTGLLGGSRSGKTAKE